jgi:ATP-dependent protease ClpP protease subunit
MKIMMNNQVSTNDSMLLLHEYNMLPDKREIFLHSYIDGQEDSGVDYRSSVILQKNIRYLTLNSLDPILIHMNMPGGDWEDCLSIFDTIKLCPAKTAVIGYGKVQSSSGVIFQSPNLRIMMPNATLLIHYGTISLDSEHSKAAASSVQWNEKETDKMVDIFVQRCIKSPISKEKKWKNSIHIIKKHIMSQISNKCDWILDADEAVYYGFADGILGSKKYPDIESVKSSCF